MIVISNDRTKIICDNGFYEFSTDDGPCYTDPQGSSIIFSLKLILYSGNIIELYSYKMFVSKVAVEKNEELVKMNYEILVESFKEKMYTLYSALKAENGAVDIKEIFENEQSNE